MTFAVFPSNKAESKKEVRLSCEVSKTQDGVVKCHDVNGKGK